MPARKTMGAGFGLALALAAIAPAPAMALEDNQILPGAKRINHVSVGGLKGACSRSGGDFIETSEEYGCATDSSWVYCEKSTGDCVGQETGKGGGQETGKGGGKETRAEPEHAGPAITHRGAIRARDHRLAR